MYLKVLLQMKLCLYITLKSTVLSPEGPNRFKLLGCLIVCTGLSYSLYMEKFELHI